MKARFTFAITIAMLLSVLYANAQLDLSDEEMAALLADDSDEETLLNIELQQMDPGFKNMLYSHMVTDAVLLAEVKQQFSSYLHTVHSKKEPKITDRELNIILKNELSLAEVASMVYS